jgi:NAD(P)-dependent dehydrogenase (short-subunit alcohol dehydrogenase family)
MSWAVSNDFVRSLRQERQVGGHPVKVTCVVPGGIRTSIARTAGHAVGVDGDEVARWFEVRIARTDPGEAARVSSGARRGYWWARMLGWLMW